MSKNQIDAVIKERQKFDKLMVLVVMQEDGSGFTVVCDHIVSHCDDLIYTHITKEYTSFVFSNNSKIEVVTDKYKGKGKRYNSVVVENGIDSERIKSIFAPLELSYKKMELRRRTINEHCTNKTHTGYKRKKIYIQSPRQ